MLGLISANSHFSIMQKAQHEEPTPSSLPQEPLTLPEDPGEYIEKGFPPPPPSTPQPPETD